MNEYFKEVIDKEVKIINKRTKSFKEAIDKGCLIVLTNCTCGGDFAWLMPDCNYYGCICHNEPPIEGKDY